MGLFMKILGIYSSLTLCISAVHAAALNEDMVFPDTLYCTGIKCLDGLTDFCNTNDFNAEEISQINTKNHLHWNGDDKGILTIDKDSQKVILDFGFGPHGGDQYLTFTFSIEDLMQLSNNKINQVSGLYEDGFDWADGYHVRALMLLSCHK